METIHVLVIFHQIKKAQQAKSIVQIKKRSHHHLQDLDQNHKLDIIKDSL
jgi:hypothetical protein